MGHPVYRLDKFQSQNSLKLSFTSIQCPCWSFVTCAYVFQSNSSDIVALCETKGDDWNESSKFSVRAYLPLIWKDSATHINGFVFYMKEGLPFSGDVPLENWVDPEFCFQLALLNLVSNFFFLYLYCLWAWFSMLFHLTYMRFSQPMW